EFRRVLFRSLEGVAQSGEITRSRAPQCDPRCNALDVHRFSELRREAAQCDTVGMQVDDGGVARGRNFPLAHRIREPLPQQTPARAGYARIEQRQQRWPSLATKRLCDFEIAPGCCIERHELVL